VTGWSYAASGIGSLPGTDPDEAARVVLGELTELPFLPELPARGPHADLAGRGAALLAELPVDLQPSGWRLGNRPSRDGRRARDLLARDLDALEQAAQAGAPPALKVQATGPWTLAGLLTLPRGERVLSDVGAMTELTASLAEGLGRHLRDLATRLPGTELMLQLDEPSLPAVLNAQVPDASGAGRLRAPDATTAADRLRTVLSVSERTVVHCCAPSPPVALLRRAGAGAVSIDATGLTGRDEDALGEAAEAGTGLLLGVVPATDTDLRDLAPHTEPVLALWRRLGLAPSLLSEVVVVTPTCGLAGASPGYAKAALGAGVEIGRRLAEAPQG